jgi:hypothetical protein
VRELDACISQAYAFAYGDASEPPVFDGDTFSEPTEVIDYYLGTLALEVLDVTARSWSSPYAHAYGERRYVEVLRTYGGPNARVRFYEDGTVTVSVYWGSDEATANVYAEAAANEVWEHADAVAQAYA